MSIEKDGKMAWIEFHTALRDHWKIERLAECMGVQYAQALGHVSCLWLWCVDYATDGNVTQFSDKELCKAARINDTIALKSLLKKCKLLDKNCKINDWKKHGVKYLLSSRKRVKDYRKRVTLQKRNGNITVTPTIPNHTIPNHTIPITTPTPSFSFDDFWKEYPRPVGMSMALLTFKATVKTDQDFKDLMQALENYKASDVYKKGFIQNGDKWIEDWRGWLTMAPKKENALAKWEVKS